MVQAAATWSPDILPGFEAATLSLSADPVPGESGELCATLVRQIRHEASPRLTRAVLYLHGWNDYFFQTQLAEYWLRSGYQFFALDLRRYGRSWRKGNLRGFITDLGEYDAEIDAAMDLIAADHDEIMLTGHSTGGLISALWADRHPGQFCGLVLNSPWLDLQGAPIVRSLGGPIVEALGARAATAVIPLPDAGLYARAVSAEEDGEWTYDSEWKSAPSAPIRVGWLRAILRGHRSVAAGLHIGVPVLVMCSDRTLFRRRWSDDLRSVDTVLDVEQIATRATRLGSCVTIIRIAGGLHDLVLSAAPVRAQVYAEIDRWRAGYASC